MRQVSLRCTYLSKSSGILRQNPLKVPVKKLMVSSKTFLTYLPIFVSYMADIFCIHIHICKKHFFPLLLFLRWKEKEK